MDDIQNRLPELYEKIYKLLKERLERGEMIPFYKINKKMRAWMERHAIRDVGSSVWFKRYHYKTAPMPEGYVGVVYEAERKKSYVKTRKLRTAYPNRFYLELPTELVSKSLVLGFMP